MPAVVSVNAGGFKATDNLRENAGIQIGTPGTERQMVQIADRHAVRYVEVARAVPSGKIAAVRRRARVGFEFLRRVVEATRVGICRAKVQAISELARECCFQAVVLPYSDG